jgi:transcriptional regulator with XRE-family HTH domain
MSTSLVAGFGNPVHATIIAHRSHPATSERVNGNVLRKWRNPMAALTGSLDRSRNRTGEAFLPVSPPGVIGGAVIKAARRSAGLSRRRLARTLAVSLRTVHGWENGTHPLFCTGYNQLCRLASALDEADAKVGYEVGDLVLASQCDLLMTGMLRGFEDYAEVPPVDEDGAHGEGEAARALLRWALTGAAPERYRPFAPAGPLLARQDVTAFTALSRNLSAGSHGDQLASYGATLIALSTS